MTGILQSLLGSVSSAAAVATDAFFNLVTLLLPGNGTNGAQNNTFLDSSSNNFSITRNGNTTQGTFSPFSQTGWSNSFDGSTNGFINVLDAGSVLDLPGDFTLEFWSYQNALATLNGTVNLMVSVNTLDLFQIFQDGTNIGLIINSANVISTTNKPQFNVWNHLAFVRSGTTVTFYLNGVAVATGSSSFSMTCTSMTIGGQNRTGATSPSVVYHGYNGYMSNFRIVKGTAVYTTNFTPSTTPLTAISGTSLLTCQSNRFIDASSNSLSISPVGSGASVQAFSPFLPTAAYSAATVGGSGYFDGTGDFLTSSHPDMNATWTIETWIYRNSGGVNQCIAMMNNGGFSGVFIFINTSNYIEVNNGVNSTGAFTNVAVPVNAWTHIAVVRSGGTTTGYINGVVAGSNTFTPSTVSAARIGQYHGGDNMFFTGYISNFRVVNGTAVYTSAFTPPTSPLTAVTNTSLLLNYTNAGITDATAKNDLETVGNAQISTTQSKFGGSSIYFDGTGDYLFSPSSQNFAFPGDFTIEFWSYITAVSGEGNTFYVNTTGGINIFLNISSNWGIARSGTAVDNNFGTPPAQNTWNHIAVSRSGSTINAYINGTRVFTGTNTSNYVAGPLQFGLSAFGSITGYIDDLRVTKFARYTGSTLTVPTAAFPLQ